MDINRLSSKIIGAAIEVHKALGPGLLESTYQSRFFFAFRPLNGKQNKKISLRPLRLCGEYFLP